MTITNTDRVVVATGNDATTVWPYAFNIPDAASANVEVTETATGTVTVIAAADYTITGLGTGSGTVTYPKSGAPLAPTHTIAIYRDVAATQTTNVTNQTKYDANVVMAVWDRIVMMVQDLKETIGRQLSYPIGETTSGILPTAATRADSVLGFDSSGVPTAGPSFADISGASASATAAAASAGAAATSETNAAGSEAKAQLWAEEVEDTPVETGLFSALHWAAKAAASAAVADSGFIFIATIDLSNDATADFTGFDSSKYDAYEFVLQNVIPVSDAILLVRTSTDGGSTYDSGASDYAYFGYNVGSGSALAGVADASDPAIVLNSVGIESTNDGLSGSVSVIGPHLAKFTMLESAVLLSDSLGNILREEVAGFRLSSADVDALRFLASTGNLASGTITMYGKVNA